MYKLEYSEEELKNTNEEVPTKAAAAEKQAQPVEEDKEPELA